MKSQIVLVTGASRGLGLEFCRQFGQLGKEVILTARNEERGLEAAKVLTEEGHNVHFRRLDVSDEADIAQLVAQLSDEFSHLDILVNNAGINSRSEGTEEAYLSNVKLSVLDPERVMNMIRINSLAPILMAKHLLPLLKKARNPKVINVSSWLGSISQKTNGGNYSYCASKATLNMMGRALAFDLAREGVSTVMMNPGWVKTDMGGNRAKLSPEESVGGMISVAEKLTTVDAGKFLQWDGTEHPW
ncbi:MAG: SDR family oxidoreductase [Bacteroidota bacterium]